MSGSEALIKALNSYVINCEMVWKYPKLNNIEERNKVIASVDFGAHRSGKGEITDTKAKKGAVAI